MLQVARLQEILLCAGLVSALAVAAHGQERVEPLPQSTPRPAAGNTSSATLPEAAPGIPLPPYGRVWVLDHVETAKLKRVFLSTAVPNRHGGENFARSQVLVMKQVSTLDLFGPAAKLRINSHTPTIFIRKSELDEEEPQSAADPTGALSHYVLLRVRPLEERRVVCSFSYWKFGGKKTRHEDDIEVTTEKIVGGQWLKLTLKKPLADGEYAVVRMPDDKSQAESAVYDFGVGPPAPTPENPSGHPNQTGNGE